MILTKNLIKYVKSLQYVKFRQKYNKFIAEGPKICAEFLDSQSHKIEYIFHTANLDPVLTQKLDKHRDKTIICNDKDFNSISSLKSPNKILIALEQNATSLPADYEQFGWGIYCDRIQDPGNLGTILRLADWFGWQAVFCSTDSVDFYNPKVIQSAMGAHTRLEMYVLPRNQLVEKYASCLYALSLDGEHLDTILWPESGILVVGNESKGVSKLVADTAKELVKIQKKGGAESLNASVACGIACHYISTGKKSS